MQGSQPSKISKDLGKIEAQLRSGKTRGSNPRGLEPEESAGGAPQSGFAALEQKRDAMRARMSASAKERTIARLNAHATTEADRVIGAVHEASAPANAYFEAIGGAGSSADLRLQGKALTERAKEQERQAKREQTEGRRAAAKSEKAARRDTKDLSTAPPDEAVRRALLAGYHPDFLPEALRRDLWEYTQSCEPYLVKFRGHDLKTRPKLIFADPNEDGEYPLYRWGQEKLSYDRVEPIPAPVRAVMDYIEERFGAKTNLAMATYYKNGADHYIPAHQDKRVTVASEGAVETASQIFNIALGAARPFVITTLSCLGKAERADMEILEEFPMSPGDLYVLAGDVNARFGHAVPKDPSITELRVSWVFRNVDAAFVNPEQQTFRTAASGGRKRAAQSLAPKAKRPATEKASEDGA